LRTALNQETLQLPVANEELLCFYEAYEANEKLAQLVREIGWSHNITILERCRDDQEREFYIRSCRKYGWTRNVLVRQIENRTFERTPSSQTNFEAVVSDSIQTQAKLAVKDEYTFAFLDLEDEHSERELERALTGRVEAFLREMGDVFAFVGSQYKVEVGEREFYIDLLLYRLVVGRGLSRIRSGGLRSLPSVISRV
jgi:predicted nuclease of restriction endonuclease-like (RecB) superfamily